MVIDSIQKIIQAKWLILVAILVALPIIAIGIESQQETREVWTHLVEYLLLDSLLNTLVLAVIVIFFALFIGTSLAWFVCLCEFPGRCFFSWALLLPFTLPTYVMGFTLFDLAQDFSFSWFLQNPVGLCISMIFSFYPYTYLIARQAFLKQGKSTLLVCRSLGHSNMSSFFRGVLPFVRPMLLISGVFIGLEVFSDFGTVTVFNYDTLTTVIYKSWYSLFSLPSAARFSLILLVFALFALFLEKWLRRRAHYNTFPNRSNQASSLSIKLKTTYKLMVFVFCFSVFSFSFILPMIKLLVDTLSLTRKDWLYLSFGRESFNSFFLSSFGTLFTLILILIISFNYRRLIFPLKRKVWLDTMYTFLNIGYALPGTVIAVGVFLSFSWLEKHFLFFGTQGLIMLILAYSIRFWSVGSNPIEKGFLQMNRNIDKTILSLGNPKLKSIFFVYLPFLRSAIGVSVLLLFLDMLKEMPMTLMIRPFGWNTLAVKIYELTSEGLYHLASFPALLIVLVSLFPIIFIFRWSSQGD